MNILELIAQMLIGQQQPTDQNRRDAGISVLPQAGGIQQTGQMTDIRRKMMEAYRMGDYETAERMQAMMQAMGSPMPMSRAGMM